ncbi:hypothetical protein PU560_05610, partial [Georgenia sp. 10Sc9-8]|nr:hypothetical protein [Georgenia halotolerans]
MTDAETSRAGPRWSLRLLDGWQLLRGEEVVHVSSREQRMLSLVALCGQQSRPRLATLLWPDSDDSRAYGNLRTAVWRVQHQQPGVLDEESGTVRISQRTHVDVDELRRVARQVSADGSPGADALTVLCHGALLPGWDEDWVVEQREVLRHVRLRALEDLARHLLDRCDTTGALEAAMLAVTV